MEIVLEVKELHKHFGELIEIMGILEEYPIEALDVIEVAPNYDLSERTQRLTAEILFHFVMH